MTPGDYLHLIEALAVALVGVGGWLWRVAIRCHGYDEKIKALHIALAALRDEVTREQAKRSTDNTRIFGRLDEISRAQAAQEAKIDMISDNCTQILAFFMGASAPAILPGGRRSSDPPLPR